MKIWTLQKLNKRYREDSYREDSVRWGRGLSGRWGQTYCGAPLCLAERKADETSVTCCSLSSALHKQTTALSNS